MTLNGLLDVPPANFTVTGTNPVSSEPVYCLCVNLTLMAIIRMTVIVHLQEILTSRVHYYSSCTSNRTSYYSKTK